MARTGKRRKPRAENASVLPAPDISNPSSRQLRREKGRERAAARKFERLMVGAVLLISALAFVNSLNGEFVYDDTFQVLKNPTIDRLANIPKMFTQSVWQFMSSTSQLPVGSYYRPVFNIALIVNHNLFGTGVFGWHLASLTLHLVVVYLVYLLARQWEMSSEAAAGAAVLFGVHPAHSESVAWVSGLPDPLAAVFIVSALILYERYCRKLMMSRHALAFCVLLVMLAMLSKEVAIAFPVFIAFREWLDKSKPEAVSLVITRVAKRTLPFAVAAIVYMGMRYAVLGFISKAEPKAVGVTGAEVLLTIPSVLVNYGRMLLVPYPLAITYPVGYVSRIGDPLFMVSALAVVAGVIVVFWLVRSSTAGRNAFLLMLLFLFPVLNLKAFNPQESLLHDRYLYIPSVGFCMLIALALVWISETFKAQQQLVFRTATASVAAILFILTLNQNLTWRNDLAMASAALELNPESPFLHNYIGAYYSQRNQLAIAEQSYLQALSIDPKYYDAHSNLGDLQRVQGRLAEAEQSYLKAIEYGAPYAETRYNLGVTYTSSRKFEEATKALIQALEIQPSHASAGYNLGWNYDQQGRMALAEQAYVETLKHEPSYPEPRINLGLLLTRQGRLKEALVQLQTAQTVAPEHPILLYGLGEVYLKLSRYDEALVSLNQLIRREPQHRLAHTALGLCYEGKGNRVQAKASFQKAIEVAPQEQYTNTAREHLAKL